MDMVDGGGVSAGRDAEGDWVWPQQASDREVQAYWVNLARQNFKDRASDQHTRNKAQGEEMPVEERERIIQELANQWTEQYFQALTNGTGERIIQAPLIDQRP
jgi:hypothetical protein